MFLNTFFKSTRVCHVSQKPQSRLLFITLVSLNCLLAPTRPQVRNRIPWILLDKSAVPNLPLLPCLLDLTLGRHGLSSRYRMRLMTTPHSIEHYEIVPSTTIVWSNLMAVACVTIGVVYEGAVAAVYSLFQKRGVKHWRNACVSRYC